MFFFGGWYGRFLVFVVGFGFIDKDFFVCYVMKYFKDVIGVVVFDFG